MGIRDAFTQLGDVRGCNASVVCSLDRVTVDEDNHTLATYSLVLLVVSFSHDRNHGLSQTEAVSPVVLILVAVYKYRNT